MAEKNIGLSLQRTYLENGYGEAGTQAADELEEHVASISSSQLQMPHYELQSQPFNSQEQRWIDDHGENGLIEVHRQRQP